MRPSILNFDLSAGLLVFVKDFGSQKTHYKPYFNGSQDGKDQSWSDHHPDPPLQGSTGTHLIFNNPPRISSLCASISSKSQLTLTREPFR